VSDPFAFGEDLRGWADRWGAYRARGFSEVIDPADKENADLDGPRLLHYFHIGADAARIVIEALIAARAGVPRRILDFPSGSGRVLRHLRALFPEAEIGACDLYAAHTAFCAEAFGAAALASAEDLDRVDLGQWDLIFCGSLLTHLPEAGVRKAVAFISRSLAAGGVAVITTEGRATPHIQRTMFRLTADKRFAVAEKAYLRTGFGYVAYDSTFLARVFGRQAGYGTTLIHPSWLSALLCAQPGIRIIAQRERAWNNHQDVVVIQARPVDE
jgi:SAM-dependent methyltransferase